MRLFAVLALLLVAGCGAASATSQTSPAPGSSPARSQRAAASAPPSAGTGAGGSLQHPSPNAAAPTSLAVLVDLFAAANAYDIALVAADGRVVATAHPHQRSAIADSSELPYVSASNSSVYYLDGDRNIRYLKPDGSTGAVTTVPGTAKVHSAFAVTADDARIAVALLDYSANPVHLTLYVEDLGGANHRVIFTSDNHYVWPVAWHAGQLVVAYLGPGAVPFKSKTVNYLARDLTEFPYGPNPYGGINFHVINPVTAQRETIISGGGASGLLTRAGTAVVQGDGVDWNGQPMFWNSPNDYGSYSASGSLSPDGRIIAACCPQAGASGQLVLWYPGGSTTVLQVGVTSADWVGWFDGSHLVTGFYRRTDGTPTVVDIVSNQIQPVNAHGIIAAMWPGGLDN